MSADYFRALGIPVLAGRALSATDRAGSPLVAVVNETGARRFWPGTSPIGKRVWFDTPFAPFSDHTRDVEIVGVVGDVKYGGVDQPDNPNRADLYTSYLQFSFPDTMIIVKARGPATPLVPALRQAVASVDAALPIYDVLTLDDRIAAAVARPRFNAALLSAFAVAALLLAAIGVYGVLSYSVSSQMRDMGVRIALGADARRVVARILGQGLRLAAIGAVIGLLGALAISRVVRGVDVFGQGAPVGAPRLFVAVAVVMLTAAGVAAFLPARRAARVDPMILLRHE